MPAVDSSGLDGRSQVNRRLLGVAHPLFQSALRTLLAPSFIVRVIGWSAWIGYLVVVSAVAVLISPIIAFVFAVLPFSLFIFNTEFQFDAPVKTLRYLVAACVAALLLWPRYLAFGGAGPDLTPVRLLNMFLLAMWLVALCSPSFRRHAWSSVSRNVPVVTLVCMYLVWRLISCIGSISPVSSLYFLGNELVTAAVLFFIVLTTFRDEKQANALVVTIVISAGVVSLLACVEYAIGRTLFSGIAVPGMRLDSEWVAQATMDKVRGGKYRAQSTFSHPLLLAEFLVFAIPFVLFSAARGRIAWRLACVGVFVLVAAASAFTGSRSALVAVPPIVGLVVLSFAMNPGSSTTAKLAWRLLLGLCGVFVLSALLVLVADGAFDLALIKGGTSVEAASTNARVKMLEQGVPLALESPFLGYGIGYAAHVLGINKLYGAVTIDNYYLSVALESGLPALVLFVMTFLGSAIVKYLKTLGRAGAAFQMCCCFAAALIGLLIVRSILSIPHNAPLIYLSAGMMCVLFRSAEECNAGVG